MATSGVAPGGRSESASAPPGAARILPPAWGLALPLPLLTLLVDSFLETSTSSLAKRAKRKRSRSSDSGQLGSGGSRLVMEPAYSGNGRLRGPRSATFPHQHEPTQVRHGRPGKVVERGSLRLARPGRGDRKSDSYGI